MNAPPLQVLPILVADAWLALDAAVIDEVIGRTPVTRVPTAIPELVGVLSWRGRVVVVVDLARLLGSAHDAECARTVIASVGNDTLAIGVAAAREVTVAEVVRPSHVARIPFSSRETEIGGVTVPIFDLQPWLASLVGAQ